MIEITVTIAPDDCVLRFHASFFKYSTLPADIMVRHKATRCTMGVYIMASNGSLSVDTRHALFYSGATEFFYRLQGKKRWLRVKMIHKYKTGVCDKCGSEVPHA